MSHLSRLFRAAVAAAALCAAACGGSPKPAPSTAVAPATPPAPPAKAASCDGCVLRGDQCLEHVEGRPPTDDDGKPLAPTEGHDFACDPACCQ